jgi:uncharacterized protein (TIGR02270 family)
VIKPAFNWLAFAMKWLLNDFIPDVVSQHAEELAFLWLLRSTAIGQPHYSIADLARLDDRIDAHLDGLRVAGASGWEVAREALDTGESGEVFAAAVLTFESTDQSRISVLLEKIAGGPELSPAVVSSLGWLPFNQSRPHIDRMLQEESRTLRRVGLAAAAAHRADLGPTLSQLAADEDWALRARALRAVGELGRVDLLPVAERHLKADDPEVRFSAAWSTAFLSAKPEALSALATIAQSDSRHREGALQMVMRRADPHAAKAWQQKLVQDAATMRLAVQGAGAMGNPAEIPWLIGQMKMPELARVAGESFTTITGIDIAYQDLEGERPEGFESGPTEDPADENVELDADENLPWPDPKLIQKWWQSNKSAFHFGTRHLLGKPITIDWCKQVLRIGRQRQRAAAALELAMRQPGSPLFEVRAPGFRQRQLLGV